MYSDVYLDDPAIRAAFAAESSEHLAKLEGGLLRLERAGADAELLRELLRSTHTLKASARLFRLEAAADLAHRLEETLISLQRDRAPGATAPVSALLSALDGLRSALRLPEDTPAEDTTSEEAGAASPPPAAPAEYVRVPAARLQAVFDLAEAWPRLLQEERRHGEHLAKLVAEMSTLCRGLRAQVGEHTDATSTALRTQSTQVQMAAEVILRERRALIRALAEQTAELQARTGELHLRPLASVLAPLARALREEAVRKGKEAILVVKGEEVELDDHILQGLSEPLTHLVRNALDHGIEEPAERVRQGKLPAGTIAITTQVRADRALIEVRDDGRGVDLAGVREQALRLGLLAPTATTSEDELLALIFRPGFSTRATADETSGRGIGMDIVHERVTRLGGRVTVETAPQRGTAFRLSVPLAASTTRVLIVSIGGVQYAIPTVFTHGVTREAPPELTVLDLAPGASASAAGDFFVALGDGEIVAALRVDAALAETAAVLRPFNPALGRPPFVSGGALRPDGDLALVLDPMELLTHGGLLTTPRRGLVAGDASARSWLREALKRAGWPSVGASNGYQALAMALHGAAEMVILAAELPGIDGLALLRLLRADPRTEHLPVIVVGHGASAWREEALAAGARAALERDPEGHAELARLATTLWAEVVHP